MRIRIFALFVFSLSLTSISHAREQVHDRSDWGDIFNRFEAQGTVVVAGERTATRSTSVYDETRAGERYSPASTFKIPHTLFAK